MEVIDYIYLVAFFLGVGFAVISGLLSGVFSGGAEVGGDVDIAGDAVHAGGADVAHGDSVPFAPVSPVTIALFIASFGGVGYILKKWAALPIWLHLPAAIVSGVVFAGLTFWLFAMIFRSTQASSHATQEEAIGIEAEVVTAIPADGVGEIAYTARGSRLTAPARTVSGKPMAAREIAKIVKVVGTTFIVDKEHSA